MKALSDITASGFASNASAFASGGGGGASSLFVQETRPVEAGPWMWWKTDAEGNLVDLIVNDGV
jgi:hypothetical protein